MISFTRQLATALSSSTSSCRRHITSLVHTSTQSSSTGIVSTEGIKIKMPSIDIQPVQKAGVSSSIQQTKAVVAAAMAPSSLSNRGSTSKQSDDDVYSLPTPNGPFVPDSKPKSCSQDVVTVTPGESDISMYKLMISAVAPRPIFLVSTLSDSGVVNVAPFSYSGIIAHSPPTVAFSCTHSSTGLIRDTLRNVRHNKECVVNMISEWFLEHANHTSGDYPPDISEMEKANLTPVPSEVVRPPRVGESAVQMESTVEGFHETKDDNGNVTCTTVFCRVRKFHISKDVYDSETDQVNPESFKVISRLGGTLYGHMDGTINIARPKYNTDTGLAS